MDSVTPPPSSAARTASAPYVYAATDERPRGRREEELCDKASRFDWLYGLALVALDAASIAVDSTVFQTAAHEGVRLIGPGLVGLSWGGTLGGGYLALPKCSRGFVSSAPPEGDVRPSWPIAVAIAILAGATAPIVVGIETGLGTVTEPWSDFERANRLLVAGVLGVGGAFLPYLVPPKTWSAAKELQHIRAGADAKGAFVSYSVSF